MNDKILILGLVEILSSLSCGIFILFVTYRLIRIYGKRRLKIDNNNLAYNILLASVLFSVAYMMSGVLGPIVDSYRLLSGTNISSTDLILRFIGYGGLYIAIAYIIAMCVVLAGVRIYSAITPMNEAEEIRNNNIGVAIVLGTVIIILALFASSGISLLIEAFIPYPEIVRFN